MEQVFHAYICTNAGDLTDQGTDRIFLACTASSAHTPREVSRT
jgi:hypothetical protein